MRSIYLELDDDCEVAFENEETFNNIYGDIGAEPEDFWFMLSIRLNPDQGIDLKFPETFGYVLEKAVKWVDEQEFFDDYTDFKIRSKIEWVTGVWRVDIAVTPVR